MSKFAPPNCKLKEGREWVRISRNDGKGSIWVQAHIKTLSAIGDKEHKPKDINFLRRLINKVFA